MCFSLTMWIHLNYGDEGIRKLFSKLSNHLKVGGHLIIEPQKWKSYKKKRHLCEEFKLMINHIAIRPS
jgi:7SK snRNA methylphosphate capping enzyme